VDVVSGIDSEQLHKSHMVGGSSAYVEYIRQVYVRCAYVAASLSGVIESVRSYTCVRIADFYAFGIQHDDGFGNEDA
jgi:hypothetical protein